MRPSPILRLCNFSCSVYDLLYFACSSYFTVRNTIWPITGNWIFSCYICQQRIWDWRVLWIVEGSVLRNYVRESASIKLGCESVVVRE